MPPNNSIFYIIKHHSTVHTKQCLYIIPYFRVFCKRVTHIFLKIFIAVELGAFLHWLTGAYELPQAGSALTGRLLFLHRRTGVRELRQRVRPNGRLLFCTDPAGHSNCRRRVRPFRAGSFPLNLSGGIRRRCGGSVPRPAAGAKRKDNLRFSFLFGLLPFPRFLIWRRFPICDRSEKGYGRGFFLPYLSQPVRSVRCHSATQIRKPPLGAAQGELPVGQERVPWGIAVPRNSSARYYRQHLRG